MFSYGKKLLTIQKNYKVNMTQQQYREGYNDRKWVKPHRTVEEGPSVIWN